jgi:hypothetical protein
VVELINHILGNNALSAYFRKQANQRHVKNDLHREGTAGKMPAVSGRHKEDKRWKKRKLQGACAADN